MNTLNIYRRHPWRPFSIFDTNQVTKTAAIWLVGWQWQKLNNGNSSCTTVRLQQSRHFFHKCVISIVLRLNLYIRLCLRLWTVLSFPWISAHKQTITNCIHNWEKIRYVILSNNITKERLVSKRMRKVFGRTRQDTQVRNREWTLESMVKCITPSRLVLPPGEYNSKLLMISHWKRIMGMKNWGKIGEGDLDRHQNLTNCFLSYGHTFKQVPKVLLDSKGARLLTYSTMSLQ